MLSCLICFKSLEFGSENVMCVPQCGHVFHESCVNRWLELNPSCPKCRIFCNSNSLLKLYFGTESLEDDASDLRNEAESLKIQAHLSKHQIEHYLDCIIQELESLSEHNNDLLSKKIELNRMTQQMKQENLMRFNLKDLNVSLNRQEERQRIDEYMQRRNLNK